MRGARWLIGLAVLAAGAASGCCRWCDRWCNDRCHGPPNYNNCCVPCCAAPPVQCNPGCIPATGGWPPPSGGPVTPIPGP